MAENVTLARPYAEAAFRIARDGKRLDAWLATLNRLASIAGADDVRAVIDNPKVNTDAIVKLLLDVAGEVSVEQKNFICVLAESDRLTVLAEIRDLYADLKNGVDGVKDAQIESAFPLDGIPLGNLVADLERRFQCRINAAVKVDPELIGGVRIAVGDEVIDASVRGKLAAMATALKH
jgi:F-type H+-transporting ATPase subunit delta